MKVSTLFEARTFSDRPGTEIAKMPQVVDAVEMFKPGGSTAFIQAVREIVSTFDLEIETDEGKKRVASLAYQIARTKTGADEKAEALIKDARAMINEVNSERKFFKDEMDKIKSEVRAPLTAWEDKEKDRLASHEMRLGEIFDACMFVGAPSIAAIQARVKKIEGFEALDWEEFADRAQSALEQAKPSLAAMLDAAKKSFADRAELEQLREEKEERERTEKAAMKSENDRLAAEAKESARLTSIEQNRIAAEQLRASNVEFRAKLQAETITAMSDIMTAHKGQGVEAVALKLFEAIDTGKVAHVRIQY